MTTDLCAQPDPQLATSDTSLTPTSLASPVTSLTPTSLATPDTSLSTTSLASPDTSLTPSPAYPAPIADPAALLALFRDPAEAGRRAAAARAAAFGPRIRVRPAPPHPPELRARVLRGDLALDPPIPQGPDVPVPPDLPAGPGPDRPDDPTAPPDPGAPGWPDPTQLYGPPGLSWLRAGDRLILRVERSDLPAYCAWLVHAAPHFPAGTSLAPHAATPGGLHRLHLIALTRLALPAHVRVEVRHDLLGIRLAQVALGFGADTLAGPIDVSRHLPLAAVPLPSETSAAALAMLVTQAGLEPELP